MFSTYEQGIYATATIVSDTQACKTTIITLQHMCCGLTINMTVHYWLQN